MKKVNTTHVWHSLTQTFPRLPQNARRGVMPLFGTVSCVVVLGDIWWRSLLPWRRDLGLFRSEHEGCLGESRVFQEPSSILTVSLTFKTRSRDRLNDFTTLSEEAGEEEADSLGCSLLVCLVTSP